MAQAEKLQNEILLREEAFLKEEKAKFTEQLNKLKVREMQVQVSNFISQEGFVFHKDYLSKQC